MKLQRRAYAKVNTRLAITGKRQDGYHTIDSDVIFTPDIYDEISICESDIDIINCDGFAVDGKNIISNAIDIFYSYSKIKKQNFRVELLKNIPVGAGLGGGSADAAAMLHLLNQYHNIGLSNADLAEIGLPLGADIPACIYSQSLNMKGVGEIITLENFNLAKYILLINPLKHVSTANIFERLNVDNLPDDNNHLTHIAVKILPEIADILNMLSGYDVASGMSGSGATCFAMSDNVGLLELIASSLPKGYWCKVSIAI